MKQEDKLYNLFRKNQHKLEEMPSPQSWDKLRRRLDERRNPRPQFTIYRLFTMVAAAVGLVLLVATVFNLPIPTRQQAVVMEEIPNYPPEVLQKAVEAHRFRSHHHQALQLSIEEGAPTKVLTTKKATRPILLPKKKGAI